MRVRSGDTGLFLHEELTLLALKDRRGTFQIGLSYDYAVGGALLAELLLNERIRVTDSTRTSLAELSSSEPVGDPLVDECLGQVIRAKRRASLQTWVSRFARVKGLRSRIGGQLCRRGIVRAEEEKILWLFNRKIYPEINPAPERRLLDQMSRAIIAEGKSVDPRTVVIISLAKSADLLRLLFDKETLQRRKARIQQIIHGEAAGKATQEALQALQAALLVTCIIPTLTVTTASR